jgi:CDP-glycerol glycerophosphotransferase (TagB/SpsB family)
MFVWGNISKKILIKLGWPETAIVVFGHTYYYYINRINQLLENPPFSKFDIDSSKKIILFTTTEMQSKYLWPGYVYDTVVLKYLLEHFSDNSNFIIILKPHPHEDLSEYEEILKKSKSTNFFIIQGNLQELLSISDIVVSNYSTVLLDAMSMKKPVLELKWGDIDENLSKLSPLIESVKIKDLKNTILNILENYIYDEKKWPETMNDFFNIPFDENKIKDLLKNI